MKEYHDNKTGARFFAYLDDTYMTDLSDVRDDDLESASIWLGQMVSVHQRYTRRARIFHYGACVVCALAIVYMLIGIGNSLMKLL